MDRQIRDLIFQAIDETISSEDFERLQDAIERDADVRAEYLRAIGLSETLGEIAAEVGVGLKTDRLPQAEPSADEQVFALRNRSRWDVRSPRFVALAIVVLAAVSAAAFWVGQTQTTHQSPSVVDEQEVRDEPTESRLAGHATLRSTVGVRWANDAKPRRDGDVLPDGILAFDEGIAAIDFFCGAALIVEGPARLDIESDWSVRVLEGRLRASVPPAARGFVVKAADSRIVDLGTEFAVEVGAESARVEVIDGEVELRGGDHDGELLVTGQSQWLNGEGEQTGTLSDLSTISDLQQKRDEAEGQRFAEWQEHSRNLREDDRLIAYFPIAEMQRNREVRNAALTAGKNCDGLLIGPAEWTAGRFGRLSAGVGFDRPGARVRTRIDGEFSAFTFACWVQIDSLKHRYNALFLGDGYENGEPHWQIRDDGRLMFSVMVDDTQEVKIVNQFDAHPVRGAGLHRVYFTEPFWDSSKSGEWFHLVAVYDPTERIVIQYVNGEEVSRQEIIDKFHIEKLRIGPAEIGNWGQPFRNTPWFAVRNLDGTIDELAIFDAALDEREVRTMYEQGKPLGY